MYTYAYKYMHVRMLVVYLFTFSDRRHGGEWMSMSSCNPIHPKHPNAHNLNELALLLKQGSGGWGRKFGELE